MLNTSLQRPTSWNAVFGQAGSARALSHTDAILDYNVFFLHAKLLDRVNTIPLNHGSEKTASRYSGAFSMMAKMYTRIPYVISMCLTFNRHYSMCKHWRGGKVGLVGFY